MSLIFSYSSNASVFSTKSCRSQVMSKMGISCISNYKRAQLFHWIGLAPDVRNVDSDASLSALEGERF